MAYWALFRPDWRNPALVLYDVPTLLLAFGSLGFGFRQAVIGEPGKGLPVLIAIGPSVILAWGAGFRSWPISGHLTVGLAIGLLFALTAPLVIGARLLFLVPATLVLAIRLFWPQIPQMSETGYTLAALAAGSLIAAISARVGR